MSIKNNEKIVYQLNELFEELIDDAVDFSKDIMLGVNLMPFAIGFFVLVTVGFSYYSFILYPSNLLNKIVDLLGVSALLYVIYFLIRKYYELRKKYSTLFNLKEKLDTIGEF